MFWVQFGLTRVAIRVGPWVLKIPRNHVGVVCNLAEAHLSETHPGERHLVPTFWTLAGWMNVQPYAGGTLDAVTDEHLRTASELGVHDCVATNIAVRFRGTWAIFDYAFSPETLLAWYASPPGSEATTP